MISPTIPKPVHGDSREFRRSFFSMVLVLTTDAILLSLTVHLAAYSNVWETIELGAITALFCIAMLVTGVVLTNRTFIVMRMDRTGVTLKRPLGQVAIPWSDVATVHFWTEVRSVVTTDDTYEEFAALVGSDRKHILLLQCTFEDTRMFEALEDFAEAAGVPVETVHP